jgi:hypothetical protein
MGRNSHIQLIALALVLTIPSAVARAGDRDFDAVVGHIKKQYHAKQQGSFGLGLARLAVKFAHPAGVKSIKLAILENLSGAVDNAGLDAVLRANLTEEWQPLVRIYSRKNREQTYVYLRPRGEDIEFFVVNVDGEDATVVKARIDPDSVADWIANSDWFDSASR